MSVIKYWNESTNEWLPVNNSPQMVQVAYDALHLSGKPIGHFFTQDRVSTTEQAQDGIDNNTVMTPLRVKEFLDTIVASDIGAAPSGYGLGEHCALVLDWNNVIDNGFYMSMNAQNSPAETYWMGYVISHNDDWVIQIVCNFTSTEKAWKIRYKNNSVWSLWEDYSGTVQTATKVEAEAGTSNEVFMTPLRTKEAIQSIPHQIGVIGKCTINYNTSTRSLDFSFTS